MSTEQVIFNSIIAALLMFISIGLHRFLKKMDDLADKLDSLNTTMLTMYVTKDDYEKKEEKFSKRYHDLNEKVLVMGMIIRMIAKENPKVKIPTDLLPGKGMVDGA